MIWLSLNLPLLLAAYLLVRRNLIFRAFRERRRRRRRADHLLALIDQGEQSGRLNLNTANDLRTWTRARREEIR